MSASAFRPYAARAANENSDVDRQSIDDLDKQICTLARSLNAETYRVRGLAIELLEGARAHARRRVARRKARFSSGGRMGG